MRRVKVRIHLLRPPYDFTYLLQDLLHLTEAGDYVRFYMKLCLHSLHHSVTQDFAETMRQNRLSPYGAHGAPDVFH